MSEPDSQNQIADPLRLDRCPDCGYLLTGLPERGICPECGFAFDQEMIVLYGWRAGTGLYGIVVPRGLAVDISLIAPVMLIALLVSLLGGLAVLLVLVAVIGTAWWRRIHPLGNVPGPIQLRLCREGFAMRRGLGPVKLRQWSAKDCVQIVPPPISRKGTVQKHVCRTMHAETLGLPRERFDDVRIRFECTPETAERIRQRLWIWGLRSL